VPKVSEEHKAEVRRRLLAAAAACLRRNGWQGLTTRELLAEAKLSTGTLYNYFPTKEHLYEALAEEMLRDDIELLTQASARGESMGVGLLRFVQDYVLTEPETAAAVAAFRSTIDDPDALDAVRRFNAWVVEEFTPLVEQGAAEGLLREDLDAAALVELLDIIWDGLGRRTVQGTFQTSHRRLGNLVLAVLTGGVLRPGAAVPPELGDAQVGQPAHPLRSARWPEPPAEAES
jgi:AcrR family transcriptional regulator